MGKPAVLAIEIISDTRRAADGIDRTNKKLSAFAKGAKIAGLAMAAFAVAKPLVEFGKQAWQAASDAQTAMAAVETVFSDSAATITDWSDTTAAELGIMRREAQQMAAVVGAQLQNLGFDTQQAADETIRLTERAADLAATFGGTTTEAVQAMGALLRGERDPIEKYGVSIKQADINARLAAEGLSGLEGEERRLAETQAALDLLFEQTAESAGAMARNEDNAAVKAQKLKAQLEDLNETIGSELIQTFDEMTEHLGAAGVSFKDVEDLVKKLGDTVRNVLAPVFKHLLGPAVEDVRSGLQALEEAGVDVDDMMRALKPLLYVMLAPLYTLGAAVRAIAWAFNAVAQAIAWARQQLDRFRVPSWLGGSSVSVAGSPVSTSTVGGFGVAVAQPIPSTTVTINVTGAIDPEGTARAVRDMLARSTRRMGLSGEGRI